MTTNSEVVIVLYSRRHFTNVQVTNRAK